MIKEKVNLVSCCTDCKFLDRVDGHFVCHESGEASTQMRDCDVDSKLPSLCPLLSGPIIIKLGNKND